MKKNYASVHWTVDDVIEFAVRNEYPIPTPAQARRLLKTIEENLSETMIATGWEIISSALECREEG